jgi:hypothetical protein
MKTYKYRLSTSFIFKTLSAFIISFPIFFLLIFFVGKNKPGFDLSITLKITLIFFGPTVILFIEYLFYSFGKKIEVCGSKVKIYRFNNLSEYEYNDVKNVTKFCSLSTSKNNLGRLPTDPFYFLKIEMFNGNVYIITSLMTDLKNFQFKINKTGGFFIPSIIYIG